MDNGDLPLRSFTVEGYRGIRRLTLPELGRVNVFVGKNNAGKTSLLEAIQLFLHRESELLPAIVLSYVQGHGDFRPALVRARESAVMETELHDAIAAVNALFYGSFQDESIGSIRMDAVNGGAAALRVTRGWERAGERSQGRSGPVVVDPEAPALRLEGDTTTANLALDMVIRGSPVMDVAEPPRALSVPAAGFDASTLRRMWDLLAVSGAQVQVEAALRSVIPELERVTLIGESRARSVVCKLAGAVRPVPITALGDGANRVFGLAVALVFSAGGALLIDEVENGLHHTVQAEVWEFIVASAEALNVQVFATTHSWDAVVAFQHAANESSAVGMLYRLERGSDGSIYAEKYTERDVAIAAEQLIEVR